MPILAKSRRECVYEQYAHTYRYLLRLAQREVSNRVCVRIGWRLPIEIGVMIL
jgi:hypothetical protein